MVPLVYSPNYDITAFGLERLHPFDSRKYRRIRDWLVRQGLRQRGDFVAPLPCTQADLLRVHTGGYLRSLRSRRELARILEVPIVGVERGLAINLGGGYHHAGADRGGGFCAYADVPLGLLALEEEGRLGSALVVDTDAHQGNGTADTIRPWPWAHQVDFFEQDIFPWPKAEEDVSVPLLAGTNGAEYLDALYEHLPAALERFRPDLVVYNAGSDVLWSDPLSRLLLTAEEMAERDLYVVSEVRERGVPLAMVLSGGYGPSSWEAHARSIEGILVRFDREVKAEG
jgi:histone deacetylase 11